MDNRKYLTEEIKKCRRRMNLAKLLDWAVLAAAAGGILGILCELVSLIREFYYVHLAAGLCFGLGLLAGAGYAVYRRADLMQAAGRLDSFGLKERMITAWEQMERDDEFARLQRQDAVTQYDRVREQIKIPLLPDRRHICALILSAAVVAGMGFIASPVRDQARLRHRVQEQAGEEQEKLEELLEALEGVDLESLTEDQRAQLQELMEALQLSREELAKADSWERLAAAGERLDYKYEQAAQSLENLAAMLNDPEAAGVAGAEALAKAAANQNGQQTASSGTPRAGSGEGGGGDKENGGGSGSGGENGSGSEGGNGDGSEGSGSESGSGDGSGNGNGNGNGTGNGNGNGNGNGSGNGNGNGSGRGTGSSDAAHDYVSVPNAVSDDSSLTGNKTGDTNSDYFRQQNGLAWEGDHVDYNSVIGEYTDNAYEGIANGRYPSGMESVIRDYFENLNK